MIIKFSHVIILKGVNEPQGGGEYHESLTSSASQVQFDVEGGGECVYCLPLLG